MNVTVDAIPEASTLTPGTVIFVLAHDAKSRGFLATFSRKTIPRSMRCRALLLAGYHDIGAKLDPKTKADLVFASA